jgi:hypothetical protein
MVSPAIEREGASHVKRAARLPQVGITVLGHEGPTVYTVRGTSEPGYHRQRPARFDLMVSSK